MRRSEIIAAIVNAWPGGQPPSKTDINTAINAFVKLLCEDLSSGEEVVVAGLGRFWVMRQNNKRSLKFVPCKEIQERLIAFRDRG